MLFRRLACAVVIVGLYASPVGTQSGDVVKLGNYPAGEENAVMFWGSIKDQDGIVFTGETAVLGNIDIGAKNKNQIVAFTLGRAPALDDDVKWSSGDDSIEIDYLDPIPVPIKFWILCADDACQGIPSNKKGKLAGFLNWANEKLAEQRAGFTLVKAGDDWISDQTTLRGGPSDLLMDFRKEKCGTFNEGIRSLKTTDAINIYMVDTVEGGEREGWQCDESYDSAVIGRRAIWGTILHEICHVLSLEHSDLKLWFYDAGGDKNLASEISDERRCLTEGQVFRIHFSKESGFNQDLKTLLPPNLPKNRRPRDCKDSTDLPCPPEGAMPWDDP